jgi:hypothetical protein
VRQGIAFVEREIEADPTAMAEVEQLLGSQMVPVTVMDGMVIAGFDEAALAAALGRDGFGHPPPVRPSNTPSPNPNGAGAER